MKKIMISSMVLSLVLGSCSKPASEESAAEAANEIATETPEISEMTDTTVAYNRIAKIDAHQRKIIRTADLTFHVGNVDHSTQVIEELVRKRKGMVTNSNLTSNTFRTREIPISDDSVEVITEYSMKNDMTIRVPNHQFDSLLIDLSKVYTVLESRTIQAEDKSLAYLSNNLKAKARSSSSSNIGNAIDKKSKKVNDVVEAEWAKGHYVDEAIDRHIENMGIDEHVAYSTVELHFSQDNTLSKRTIFQTDIDVFESPFIKRLSDAIVGGWSTLLTITLFAIRYWSIILMAAAGYVFYKKMKK